MKTNLHVLKNRLMDLWIAYHIDQQLSGWQAVRHAVINLWLWLRGGLGS